MMDKANYYLKSLETLDKEKNRKPSLLLHVCCGPCACFPLVFLSSHFNITIYYTNSNIYPESEYQKRLKTLKALLKDLKRDFKIKVKLIVPKYDHESFMNDLKPLASCKEGEGRCFLCYEKRMEEAYSYAERKKYDYFTTIMTVSRQKSSQKLNEIGEILEKKHPNTKYFYSDFKKANGALIGQHIREYYDLYNQHYCGCEYSLKK